MIKRVSPCPIYQAHCPPIDHKTNPKKIRLKLQKKSLISDVIHQPEVGLSQGFRKILLQIVRLVEIETVAKVAEADWQLF